MISLVQRAYARNLVDRALLQMVLQVAADALQVMRNVDAVLLQPITWPDAGAMQDCDRTDRAGGENDLAAGTRLDHLVSFTETHADRALAREDQSIDQHVGLEPHVGPVQRRLEKAARRRPAPAAPLIDMEEADAFVVSSVEVSNSRDTHLGCGICDGVQHVPPYAGRLDAPAAAGAVVLAVAQEMILDPLEHRTNVIPAPPGEPKL